MSAAENSARLLDEMGIEDRSDEEIEADHRASRLAAAREYAPDTRLDEEPQPRPTGPDDARCSGCGDGAGVLTIRLPDDLDAEVRKAATDAGLSLNAYVVRTLREQTLRNALASVDSESALLVDTGHADPAEDVR